MRGLLRLSVFVALGLFAACATSNDPVTNTAADSGADAKPKDGASDGTSATDATGGDDANVDEDAGDTDAGDTDAAATDAAQDTAVADTSVADTSVADTAVADTSVTDAGVDADDGSTVDAADDSAISDAGADADDGAITDAAPDVAPVDAGCNDLTYGSGIYTIQDDPIATPTATGGTVGDGTYHLSSYTHYTGVGGSSGPGVLTLRSTVRIAGNKIDILRLDYTGIEKRWSGTFQTSGSTITIDYTCPAASQETGSYSAAPSKFAFYPFANYEAVHTK